MNSIQLREMMLNGVMQQFDAQVRTIEDLQKKVAELQKQLDSNKPLDVPLPDNKSGL